jgi:hypothetical protein
MEVLGSPTCQPVPGCDAAFPPPGATLFVSASYTPAELDSAHFLTVTGALAVAPASAIIAVDDGTYTDAMAPTLPVTVIGRCAATVVFQPPPSSMAGGIEVNGAENVRFANMTLEGYLGGVSVFGGSLELDSVVVQDSAYVGVAVANDGAQLTLSNVVVRGTVVAPGDTNAFGLYVGDGAKATVTGSVFAGNEYINVGVSGQPVGGASLTLSSSVVRDGQPLGSMGFGWGVYASGGVTATISNSAILNNQGMGFNLYSSSAKVPAKGSLVGSVVLGTTADTVNQVGYGAESVNSSLQIEGSTIVGSPIADVYIADGSTGTVTGSTLVGSPEASDLGPIGLLTHDANVTVEGTAIVNTRAGTELQASTVAKFSGSLIQGTKTSPEGYYVDQQYVGVGMLVETPAHVDLTGTAIVGTHTAGILTVGELTAQGLVVSGTRAGGDGSGGRGLSLENGGHATISGAVIRDSLEVGIGVLNASPVLTLTGSVVEQTAVSASGQFGGGITLSAGATGTISTTTVRSSAGIAVGVQQAAGSLQTCVLVDNSIGVYVTGGTTLAQGGAPAPLTLTVSTDTLLVGNTTNIGSGVIPLPTVLMTP